MAIGCVSDDAFAGGALPDADQSSDFPVAGWLWRVRKLVVDETLGTGVLPPLRVTADLRSMRKLERSTLVLVHSNDPVEGTAFQVRLFGLVRCLYKLP